MYLHLLPNARNPLLCYFGFPRLKNRCCLDDVPRPYRCKVKPAVKLRLVCTFSICSAGVTRLCHCSLARNHGYKTTDKAPHLLPTLQRSRSRWLASFPRLTATKRGSLKILDAMNGVISFGGLLIGLVVTVGAIERSSGGSQSASMSSAIAEQKVVSLVQHTSLPSAILWMT